MLLLDGRDDRLDDVERQAERRASSVPVSSPAKCSVLRASWVIRSWLRPASSSVLGDGSSLTAASVSAVTSQLLGVRNPGPYGPAPGQPE